MTPEQIAQLWDRLEKLRDMAPPSYCGEAEG